jgi:hypothetical protein
MAPELSRLLQVGATYSLDKETLVAIADKELTPIKREKGRARSLKNVGTKKYNVIK